MRDTEFEPKTRIVDTKEKNNLKIDLISNLKVRKSIPKVEISYFSESEVRRAYGEIIKVEEDEIKKEKAVSGHQYPTDGIVLTHELEDLKVKIDTDENKDLLSSAYSAGYGLRSSISRKFGVDTLDIQCFVIFSDKEIKLVIYDREVGGAGISYSSFQDIGELLDEVRMILGNCVCPKFCEKCLLLPRTPNYMIERGLLNRFKGLKYIS